MKRLLLIAALAAAACTSPPVTQSGAQFAGLSGLAATSAGDRDLLFVSSTGSDDLRALNLCSSPILADGGIAPLPDGGPGVPDTCPPSENLQFLPGPIRVLPAAIQTSDRPVRVAGPRLTSADGSIKSGAAIVAGAENALRVVDAKNLIDAANHRAAAVPPLRLPLDAPAVDVVAANPLSGTLEVGAVSVRAFAATEQSAAAQAKLLVLDVRLDPATGIVQLPTIVQSCSLGAIAPRKLAVTPGVNTAVYVADGAATGDGAVRIDVASIPAFVAGGPPPAACTIAQKITAGGRPLRSLAVSPTYFQAGPNDAAGNPTIVAHAAGELLAGVTVDGGVIFMRTSDGTVLPVPPFPPAEAGHPAMKPLFVPSNGTVLPMTDIAFLVPPAPNPPTCIACTTVVVGGFTSTALARKFDLVATASNIDGGAYFLAPLERRFLSDTRDGSGGLTGPVATITQAAVLTPTSTDPNKPTIPTINVNTGVTQTAPWRLQFHGPLPGLERRGGTITSTASGTLLLTTTPADLTRWTGSPLTALAPGDVAALIIAPAAAGQQLCPDLASETPLRVELPIVKVNPGSIELATVPDSGGVKGFHPSTDPAAKCFPFGAVAEVRAAGTAPWVVFANNQLRGRAAKNVLFTSPGLRFDYPLIYDPASPPLDDTEISFTILGNDPTVGSILTFATASGFAPTNARDTTLLQGLAQAVIAYNSPRSTNLIFESISGANVLLKADPALLNAFGGIVSYR